MYRLVSFGKATVGCDNCPCRRVMLDGSRCRRLIVGLSFYFTAHGPGPQQGGRASGALSVQQSVVRGCVRSHSLSGRPDAAAVIQTDRQAHAAEHRDDARAQHVQLQGPRVAITGRSP